MSQVIVNYKLEPKIYHFIPWNSDKKIGVSYNQSMKMISDVDWACFIDGDAVHTTSYFGKRIEENKSKILIDFIFYTLFMRIFFLFSQASRR